MRIISIIGPIILCTSLCSIVSYSYLIYNQNSTKRFAYSVCPKTKCNNDTKVTTNSNISGCQCDLQCHLYGDCCEDAPTATNMNFSSLPVVNCSSIPSILYPIYTISWCGPSSAPRVARFCRMSLNFTDQGNNPQINAPVTDTTTNITYGNIFCARCHNVRFASQVYWSMNLTCPSHNESVTFPRFNLVNYLNNRKFTFNNDTSMWQFTNEKNQKENCSWLPVPPSDAVTRSLRRCETNVVSDCPPSSNAIQPNTCPGYVAYVSSGTKFYRNLECASCNNIGQNVVHCQSPRLPPLLANIPERSSWSNPLWSPSSTSSPAATSSSTTSSAASTRNSSITGTSTAESSGERGNKALKNKKRAYLYIQFNANCKQILNQMNITKVVAETVYYNTLNRTFVTGTKKIVGTAVEVCDMTREKSRTEYELYAQEYRMFTFTYIIYDIFLLASALLNVIYLCWYAMSKETSTQYSKALVSFAFTLFLAHIGSILTSITILTSSTSKKWFCLLHSLLESYGHLAGRFWVVSIAFEVTASIWEIGCGLSTSGTGRSWTRFTVYSWLSWLVPAIMIATTFRTIQSVITLAGGCSFSYNPRFSIFVPVSMTSALYLSSVYAVRTQSEVLEKLSKVCGVDFSLHTILTVSAVLMNLTNLSEFDLPIFSTWFLFCMLNFTLAISICLHSSIQNALLNNLKLYIDKYIGSLLL